MKVYRDPRQVEGRDRDCHPQLKATAVILGSDFASNLEKAIKRSDQCKLIEAQAVDEAIS
jgi:hypothetical protein